MSVFEAVKPHLGPFQGAHAPQSYQPYQHYQNYQAYQPYLQQPTPYQQQPHQQHVSPMAADAAAKLAPLMIGVVAEALRLEPQALPALQATGQIPPHLYPVALMEAANRIAPVLHGVLAQQMYSQAYQQQLYPQQPYGPQPYPQQQPYLQQAYGQPHQYPLQQPFAQHQQQPQPQPYGPQQHPAFPGR